MATFAGSLLSINDGCLSMLGGVWRSCILGFCLCYNAHAERLHPGGLCDQHCSFCARRLAYGSASVIARECLCKRYLPVEWTPDVEHVPEQVSEPRSQSALMRVGEFTHPAYFTSESLPQGVVKPPHFSSHACPHKEDCGGGDLWVGMA
eukprot:3074633-Amphidinium_carterae.1